MKMIFNKSRFKILLFCLKRKVNLKVLKRKNRQISPCGSS